MTPVISSQQAYFFKHNGYIELESLFSPEECAELKTRIESALFGRLKRALRHVSDRDLYVHGRDLWREEEALKHTLLSKKMTSIAFGLTDKPALHLACDQWLPPMSWPRAVGAKDLFSIQGLACVYFLRLEPPLEGEGPRSSTFALEPGLIPLPSKQGSLLILHPNLLLNLPKLSLTSGLYIAAYASPQAVYHHNSEDPSNHQLKALGYQFGDRLLHAHHPLIYKPNVL